MKVWLYIICFLLACSSFSQKLEAEKIAEYPLQADHFIGIDKYESSYTIEKNVLYKTSAERVRSFSVLSLGNISSVDILNPLKIVVFYRETNTLVILDDKLSEIERISFNSLPEFKSVAFMAKAGKNALWIFNEDTKEIEVFDIQQKKSIAHTQPISWEVKNLQGNFNFVWILTPREIRLYNIYGSFIKSVALPQYQDIRFYNDYVIALKDNQLLYIDYKNQQNFSINTSSIQIKDFYTANQNLYLFDGKLLYYYRLAAK